MAEQNILSLLENGDLYDVNGRKLLVQGDVPDTAGGIKALTDASSIKSPKAGTIYYNTTDKTIYIYTGTTWNPLGQRGLQGPKGDDGKDAPTVSSVQYKNLQTNKDDQYTYDIVVNFSNGSQSVTPGVVIPSGKKGDKGDPGITKQEYDEIKASLDSFFPPADKDYTKTPEGDNLSKGDTYFNTTDKSFHVFDGTQWFVYNNGSPNVTTYSIDFSNNGKAGSLQLDNKGNTILTTNGQTWTFTDDGKLIDPQGHPVGEGTGIGVKYSHNGGPNGQPAYVLKLDYTNPPKADVID